jgi:methylenetetrahydrofolate--tRNA-(uracil-5-)-methyltransferase
MPLHAENRQEIMTVNVVGGGLAGCECAYRLAQFGVQVNLYDMKPELGPAFVSTKLSEIVCSNSLKSEALDSAPGLLKAEMKALGSLTLESAYLHRVPSGQDLAVDREAFSSYIDEKIRSHPNIHVISQKIDAIPDDGQIYVICTGPLTDKGLMDFLKEKTGEDAMGFFDAAAPLVYYSSLDVSKMYVKSRYDKGEGKYLNIPLNEEEYYRFTDDLVKGEKVVLRDFEHFEGCLPLETMAERGKDTLRFGPLKPKGLEVEGSRPFAVVQLRQDDAAGELYGFVGFQTNLKPQEQKRIISSLPGLSQVKFARFGQMHRNSYICAPRLLQRDLSLKKLPDIFIGGQLSGVEGYMESAASGLLAAYYIKQRLSQKTFREIPLSTMLGSLINYLIMSSAKNFQPMNACYGILQCYDKRDKEGVYNKSMKDLDIWLKQSFSK